MDYFPRIFSQNDLFWLDNLMPDSKKKTDAKRTENKEKRLSENESEEDFKVIEAPLKNMAVIKERLPHFLLLFFRMASREAVLSRGTLTWWLRRTGTRNP